MPREERFMMRTAFFFRELLKNTVAVLHPFADIFNKFMIPALDLLRKCQGKMDCLVYEMLLNKKYRPSLNIQSDSIRAKIFTLLWVSSMRSLDDSLA